MTDIIEDKNPTELFCEKHDAYYSAKEDKWTEKKCPDPNCKFCKDRPDKPSEVK